MGTDLHFHGINVPNDMDGVAPAHPAAGRAGRDVHLRVRGRRAGRGHVPRPPPRPAAGAQRHVGHVLRRRHGAARRPDDRWARHPRRPDGRPGAADGAERRRRHRLSLNGKSFPATAPIAAEAGRLDPRALLQRGLQIHPMHLHQFDQLVIAKDGVPLDHPYSADTVNVAPGERYIGARPRSTGPAPGSGTATSSTTSRARRACSAWSPPSS